MSLFAVEVILYIENPKDTTRNTTEPINEFIRVAGYKINPNKSVTFLDTYNETKREIKEAVPFTITAKRIKYLGINLPKETKNLYCENCETLVKEIEDNTNRWENIL